MANLLQRPSAIVRNVRALVRVNSLEPSVFCQNDVTLGEVADCPIKS
jgi:hypothetical protein